MKWKSVKVFFLWSMGTFLLALLLTAGYMFYLEIPGKEILENLPMIMEALLFRPIGWFILLTPYLLSRLISYLFHSYKKRGSMIFLKRLALVVLLPVATIFIFGRASKVYKNSEQFNYEWDTSVENVRDTVVNRFAEDHKQRGMHLFGRREMKEEVIQQLLKDNIEWLTFVPFVNQKDYDSEQLGRRGGDYSTLSRRDSSLMSRIKILQSKGFRIMMKPHIWMSNPSSGKWRADIFPTANEGWDTWSASYRSMITHYARMSEMLGIELLCIGTELHKTVKEHPAFWKELIQEIRKIYSGQLTYAANWNQEVEDVSFWSDLDFIGIQAYYPLTSKHEPEVKELMKGWRKHVAQIEKLHKKYDRPVLFTELGYKSTSDSAIEPWQWANGISDIYTKISNRTQANCYEAFFRTFWKKKWFAGVHIWEWQAGRRSTSDWGKSNFTPQHKPAENIMTKWFGRLGKVN